MSATERTGVLLIRVWAEEGYPGLRARITYTRNLAGLDQTVTFATTVADINAAVTTWLRPFVDEPGS